MAKRRRRRSTQASERGPSGKKFSDKQWRDCQKKEFYAEEGEARSVAILINSSSAEKIDTYECPVCGGFHLTSH